MRPQFLGESQKVLYKWPKVAEIDYFCNLQSENIKLFEIESLHMLVSQDYRDWLTSLKQSIRQRQIKASLSVNRELLLMYWDLGKDIVEKQKSFKWGDGFLKQLSQDLQREFPEMQGWSERNLRRIRLWYQTYSQYFSIRTQTVSELKSTEPIPLAAPHVGLPSNITEENQLLGQDAFFSVPWGITL